MAELDTIVELGRRGPGSDAERRTARHLEQRLEQIGRSAETESLPIYAAWPIAYAILASAAVGASVLAVYVPVAGAALALAVALLTFLDAGMLIPTVRRLLGRRASQNVVSWGERDKPGAVLLVAHYDTGPTRMRPLLPMFVALLLVLACCVLRAGGMEGTALTVVQFIPTVVLIVYVALLLDIALSPAGPGESDNASGVAVVLRLAERLGDELEYFGVHVVFTGSQKAMAQGMRAFLQSHRKELKPGDTVVLNLDAVGGGELRETKSEGPLLTVKSHPQLTGNLESDSFKNREPSDGYAAASGQLPAITVTCSGERLEEDTLAEVEEFCVEFAERLDEELSPPER